MTEQLPGDLNAIPGRYVSLGGNRIRVVTCGSGPPLLMVNGIGSHIAMWEPLARELARTRQLILFDAPGCGRSPVLKTPLRMSGLAALLADLLDALDLGEVDVLGYSWGGTLAQQFAHDRPDRVRRLVLASTIPGLGGWPPSMKVMALMSTSMRYQSKSLTRLFAAHIYGGDQRRPSAQSGRHRMLHWNDHPPTAIGYMQQMFALTGWSSLPWLRAIRSPTLILSGADDPLVPSVNAKMLARLIPQAELDLVRGGGHLWLLEHPRTSADTIERFLSHATQSIADAPIPMPWLRVGEAGY